MECKKCRKPLAPDWVACPFCGTKPDMPLHAPRKRANGTGTAFRRNGQWVAQVTMGMYLDPQGNTKRKYKTKSGFKTKTAAFAYCAELRNGPEKDSNETLYSLFQRWQPTHEGRVGASTMAGYKAAFQHFSSIHAMTFQLIRPADWQACIDACLRGKRTKEDMRAVAGLLNKFA